MTMGKKNIDPEVSACGYPHFWSCKLPNLRYDLYFSFNFLHLIEIFLWTIIAHRQFVSGYVSDIVLLWYSDCDFPEKRTLHFFSPD